jgi:hypothetical protein
MAKKKALRERKETQSPAPAAEQREKEETQRESLPKERSVTLKEYLLLNLLFDIFCLVQLVLVRLFLAETRGLYFFFIMLMIGFLIVSIFDYLYEKLQARELKGHSSIS